MLSPLYATCLISRRLAIAWRALAGRRRVELSDLRHAYLIGGGDLVDEYRREDVQQGGEVAATAAARNRSITSWCSDSVPIPPDLSPAGWAETPTIEQPRIIGRLGQKRYMASATSLRNFRSAPVGSMITTRSTPAAT